MRCLFFSGFLGVFRVLGIFRFLGFSVLGFRNLMNFGVLGCRILRVLGVWWF